MNLTYRGGTIWRDYFGFNWSGPRVGYVAAWYRLAFPLLFRFRSEEEALRILCERVDAFIDANDNAERLCKAWQAELQAREAVMRDIFGEEP